MRSALIIAVLVAVTGCAETVKCGTPSHFLIEVTNNVSQSTEN